jgi:hypothetical protein
MIFRDCGKRLLVHFFHPLKNKNKPGAVAHTCNPSNSQGRDHELKSSPDKKFLGHHFNQ